MTAFSLTPLVVVEHTKQTPAWNLPAVILQTMQYPVKHNMDLLMHNKSMSWQDRTGQPLDLTKSPGRMVK